MTKGDFPGEQYYFKMSIYICTNSLKLLLYKVIDMVYSTLKRRKNTFTGEGKIIFEVQPDQVKL